MINNLYTALKIIWDVLVVGSGHLPAVGRWEPLLGLRLNWTISEVILQFIVKEEWIFNPDYISLEGGTTGP